MRTLVAVAVLTLLPVVARAQAPLPFAIEARGAFAVPTGEWTDEDGLENGFGFGGAVRFNVLPTVGIYAGWDRFSFGFEGDEALEDGEANAIDAGFRAGLEASLPIRPGAPARPFAQVGLVYNTLTTELSGDGGSIEFEADAALGFEIAAGASFAAGPVSLRPTVFYRSHSAEFDDFSGLGESETTTAYFGVLLGVAFGG